MHLSGRPPVSYGRRWGRMGTDHAKRSRRSMQRRPHVRRPSPRLRFGARSKPRTRDLPDRRRWQKLAGIASASRSSGVYDERCRGHARCGSGPRLWPNASRRGVWTDRRVRTRLCVPLNRWRNVMAFCERDPQRRRLQLCDRRFAVASDRVAGSFPGDDGCWSGLASVRLRLLPGSGRRATSVVRERNRGIRDRPGIYSTDS